MRSWQAGYRGLLPDEYLDSLRPEDRARRYTFGSTDPNQPATLVALLDGTIRGFATTAPARDSDAVDRGELAGLYVDPGWWGRGIGQALLTVAHDHLVKQRFEAAVLWVLDGNVRARRFYEADGWVADGHHRVEAVWGVKAGEARFARSLR